VSSLENKEHDGHHIPLWFNNHQFSVQEVIRSGSVDVPTGGTSNMDPDDNGNDSTCRSLRWTGCRCVCPSINASTLHAGLLSVFRPTKSLENWAKNAVFSFFTFTTMPRFLILPSTPTLLAFILTLLFGLPFRHFVCASITYDRPFITYEPCYTSVGQALYVIGGNFSLGRMHHQAFVLDLSVSWNTDNPVVRQLQDAPKVPDAACTMFNNGEDLFLLSMGTGYIYNIKSDSWKVLQNNNFIDGAYIKMATDPESGIIYTPNGGMDFSGRQVVLALDMTAGTINALPWPGIDLGFMSIAWCAPLGRFLIVSMSYYYGLETFTPSIVSESSNGWRTLNTTGGQELDQISITACFLPAYDGWKMVYISNNWEQDLVYFLDVATLMEERTTHARTTRVQGVCHFRRSVYFVGKAQ